MNDDAMRSLAARLAAAERLGEARAGRRQKRDEQTRTEPTPTKEAQAPSAPKVDEVESPAATLVPLAASSMDTLIDVPSAPGLVDLWLRSYVGTTQSTYRDIVRDYERTVGEPMEGLLVGRGRAHGLAKSLMQCSAAPSRSHPALRSFPVKLLSLGSGLSRKALAAMSPRMAARVSTYCWSSTQMMPSRFAKCSMFPIRCICHSICG